MNIVLLGAPGSGKGFVANLLQNIENFYQLSTGDILRHQIKLESEIGKQAENYMKTGALVPDEIVIGVFKEELNELKKHHKNFIFDGFPRSLNQAELLDQIINIDKVILLDVPYDVIIDRILSRRVCSGCAKVYSTKEYSSDKCECGANLIVRPDDNLSVIKNRLNNYDEYIAPIIEYYKNQNKLISLNVNTTGENILNNLKQLF